MLQLATGGFGHFFARAGLALARTDEVDRARKRRAWRFIVLNVCLMLWSMAGREALELGGSV